MAADLPWYEIVDNKEPLLQGDFIPKCPIINPLVEITEDSKTVSAEVIYYDVIVLSQSCDLVEDKINLVLVCPYTELSEFVKVNKGYDSDKGKEALRRGYVNDVHLLNQSTIPNFKTDFLVVDFGNVYSVPLGTIRNIATSRKNRLRLNSPYREHLSQAFARFFMRVGLPVDIPPFK